MLPRFALTFDDGPGPATADVLDTLAAFEVPATFFILGVNVDPAGWSDAGAEEAWILLRRMVREGHIVGNHTVTHGRDIGATELIEEIRQCDALVEEAYRSAQCQPMRPIPFRLPYGVRLITQTLQIGVGRAAANFVDPRLMAIATIGRTHVHWTSLFDDWSLTAANADVLAEAMLRHVEDCAALGVGAVLALHDSGPGDKFGYHRPATALALRGFLETARLRRWQAFTVPA